jgi:hypothetical protein
VAFKQTHGHCRVPLNVPELGRWAKYQRDQYVLHARGKKSKITKEKIDLLTSIGFEESLEERVALGLSGEDGEGEDDGGGLVHDGIRQHRDHQDGVHLQHDGVAYQQHGELQSEDYLRCDPGAYSGVQSVPPDSGGVSY